MAGHLFAVRQALQVLFVVDHLVVLLLVIFPEIEVANGVLPRKVIKSVPSNRISTLSKVILDPLTVRASALPSWKSVADVLSSAFTNAEILFRGVIVELLMLVSTAKAPLGLIGAILRLEEEELLDEKEITSSIAQSGIRFLAASRWCRGMKRSLRQLTLVVTLPRSFAVLNVAFPYESIVYSFLGK